MSQINHTEINLKPFDRQWSETVLSWITSPDELWYWSAQTDFPLTNTAVFEKWHSDPEISAYLLLTGITPVAYGEVWFDKSDNSAELGRLVVSPRHRRQGFGRLLIKQLSAVAHNGGYEQACLRVLPENTLAIGCYESAGFRRVSNGQQAALNAAERIQFVWMVADQD